MMNFFGPPERISTTVFTALPDRFRKSERSAWADANKHGSLLHSFLEGPSFDRSGNLYVTDIPYGRIFRISSAGEWELVIEYDGWPNGLKVHRDGRIFIADRKNGILILDPETKTLRPVVETFLSERFKGVNDLVFSSTGDLYFTDQGQTGLQDPTGRVFRLSADGRLDLLADMIPSPNGIVLSPGETQIHVAVTRGLAIWRLPLTQAGQVTKVGLWIQLSGGRGGPDGLALDEAGGLIVAHGGLCVWRFDSRGIPTHVIEPCTTDFCTNIAFGGPDRRTLFIVDSESGSILKADMPFSGKAMFSHT